MRAGPAMLRAIAPVETKIPAPITAPIPRLVSVTGPRTRRSRFSPFISSRRRLRGFVAKSLLAIRKPPPPDPTVETPQRTTAGRRSQDRRRSRCGVRPSAKPGAREEASDEIEREPHDVRVRPFDPRDEDRGAPLDLVGPRGVHRLADRDVGGDLAARQTAKEHLRDAPSREDPPVVPSQHGDAGDDAVAPPREKPEHAARVGRVAGFAQDEMAQRDDGVRADHERASFRGLTAAAAIEPPFGDGDRLLPRQAHGENLRRLSVPRHLGYPRGHDQKSRLDETEEPAAPRRSRGEDQGGHGAEITTHL